MKKESTRARTQKAAYIQMIAKREWASVRSMLGNTWALLFVLLGARETGKTYVIDELFVKDWKKNGVPFYKLRLNEAALQKMLVNNAERAIDPVIRRKYDLDLTVRGGVIYDHGKKMCTCLALSTFYNDKGSGFFDHTFLNDPKMRYNIILDEFEQEAGQRSQGDIAYQFIQQLENLIRSTKERVRIFLVGNTLQEASDILAMLDFIPESFGRYKLKRKKTVIDYMPPTEAYKARRSGTLQDILAGSHSNFTNEIDFDRALIAKRRLIRPTAILHFSKDLRFTVWDDLVISTWNREKCKVNIAMRPYQDVAFDPAVRDAIIESFDQRRFFFKNMISQKKFQAQLKLIKPRKG